MIEKLGDYFYGKDLPDEGLYGDKNLSQCPDFLNEKSALEELVESRGHILLVGVCCHPELAGCGVEYCFGMSKRHYRKNNDLITSEMESKVKASFHEHVISYVNINKFERRARTYMNMYLRDFYEAARRGQETMFTCDLMMS